MMHLIQTPRRCWIGFFLNGGQHLGRRRLSLITIFGSSSSGTRTCKSKGNYIVGTKERKKVAINWTISAVTYYCTKPFAAYNHKLAAARRTSGRARYVKQKDAACVPERKRIPHIFDRKLFKFSFHYVMHAYGADNICTFIMCTVCI